MAGSNKGGETFGLLLQCALCNEELVNTQPKSLPCLHTFCTQCLTSKRQQFTENDIISCPVCHTIVGSSSADSEITENFQLNVIIEKLLKVRRLQQRSERHCEMCPEGAVATHWCQDCSKHFCDSCLVHHERYKPKDKIIDVSQGVNSDNIADLISPSKCLRHGKKLKMYCVQCEICLCSTCLQEHRSDENMNCVPVSIEEMILATKSEGQQLLEETFSYLEEEKKEIDDMKVKRDDLKRQYLAKGEEIWDNLEETVRRLKENARKFLAELEAETKKESDQLEKLIQLRQNLVSKMEIIDIHFRQLLHSFDNADILNNFSRLKSSHKNVLLTKTKDQDSNILRGVNMAYNTWYLKIHEMSNTIPLGRCWKDSELTEGATLSDTDRSLLIKQTSITPPVPTLCYPFEIETLAEMRDDPSCLFVTDDGKNHIFVAGGAYGSLYEYTASNVLRGIYVKKGMKYCVDVCSFSSDKICVLDGNLNLFQINPTSPFLTFFKREKPNVKYYSICNCSGEILVCNYNCCVHLLTENGTVGRTVLDRKRSQSSRNLIRRGSFKGTFLLFDYNDATLYCYRLFDSKCLFSVNVGYICDLCTDKYGNIFVVDKEKMYVLNPDASEKRYLFTLTRDMHVRRLFIRDNIFYFLSDLFGQYAIRKFYLHYY